MTTTISTSIDSITLETPVIWFAGTPRSEAIALGLTVGAPILLAPLTPRRTLKLADELDDLMIAYLKACRETPDKAPGLEKKMKAKTAQLAALQDQGIDAHPSWADVE